MELRSFFGEGVGPDHDVRGASPDQPIRVGTLARAEASGDELDVHLAPLPQQGAQRPRMLLGEDLGRRHERGLVPVLDREERGAERDRRLAAPDVALEEPVHRLGLAHVEGDLLDGALLRRGQRPGQLRLDSRDGRIAGAEGDPGLDLHPPTPQCQPELDEKQLLEGEAPVRLAARPPRHRGGGRVALGKVRFANGVGERPKSPARQQLRRKRFAQFPRMLLDRLASDAPVGARRQSFDLRVDRYHPSEGIVAPVGARYSC